MLWIYNNNELNQNDTCEFYQVFFEYNLDYSDGEKNDVYSFNSTSSYNYKLDLNNYKSDNIKCEINIIDHVISYNILNIKPKKQYVFTFKTNFIEPKDNQYKLPLFNNIYKLTNTKKLPNLIETEYNFSSILDFEIYKLDENNNTLFVVESNSITKSIRKYFITNNLDLIKQFI